jgi:hypothetical protein
MALGEMREKVAALELQVSSNHPKLAQLLLKN